MEVIWHLFLTFQNRKEYVFFKYAVYVGKLHTHRMYLKYSNTSDRGREKENNSSYMDGTRGLSFSWLISLNLLIPILKLTTSHSWLLLYQIKLSFILLPFKCCSISLSPCELCFASLFKRPAYLNPDAV